MLTVIIVSLILFVLAGATGIGMLASALNHLPPAE